MNALYVLAGYVPQVVQQQIEQPDRFPIEAVVALIGLIGTLGAAWIVTRRKK